MAGKFEGCIAYIYDLDGNLLTTSKIYEHDKSENSIEVSSSQILLDNRKCKLFILSTPTPYACTGTVHPKGLSLTIKLFQGKEKESRGTARYNLTGIAIITTYICDKKKYGLHKPIETELMNISTTGVRFRTRFNTLSKGDIFDFHLKIGDNLKSLTAKVVNIRDKVNEGSEYGCILTGDDDA